MVAAGVKLACLVTPVTVKVVLVVVFFRLLLVIEHTPLLLVVGSWCRRRQSTRR